jgi:probable rRNA maturation factor
MTSSGSFDFDSKQTIPLVHFLRKRWRLPAQITIDIAFADEPIITELHVRYMGLPGPTDVLSFPNLDVSNGLIDPQTLRDEPILGDIVICPDFIKRTGGDASSEVNIESCLIHGFLHLLGYDHQTAPNAKVMFEKQEALMLSWQKSK